MKNCRKTELMQLNLPKWIALWPDCEYALRRSIQVSVAEWLARLTAVWEDHWNHWWRLCLLQQLLRYTALGTGCALLLQCLGRLSLPPSVGWQNEYQLMGWVIITMARWMWVVAASFRWTHSPSRLAWSEGFTATRCSVYIHQMNWVNSRSDFGQSWW